jgi:hypothetical protein
MFRYFVANWEPCEREWLMFLRGNVAHLGNNTNNRIESKWGAVKRILNARMDMEETIRSLRELQAINEDEYIDLLTKTGTRHSYTGDPELDMLINMLSDHAYDLVSVRGHFVYHSASVSIFLLLTSPRVLFVVRVHAGEKRRCSVLCARGRRICCIEEYSPSSRRRSPRTHD